MSKDVLRKLDLWLTAYGWNTRVLDTLHADAPITNRISAQSIVNGN